MAVERASYVGIPQIMAGFDTVIGSCPWWSVWINARDIMFQYNGDDKENGRQVLEDALTALESTGHNAVLIIKFHPKKDVKPGYVTNKTHVFATMQVRVCALGNDPAFIQNSTGVMVAGTNTPIINNHIPGTDNGTMLELITALKAIPEQMKADRDAIELRLSALEDVDDEDDEPIDLFARVTGFMETPTGEKVLGMLMPVIGKVVEAAGPAIGSLLAGFTQPAQNVQVNGVKQDTPAMDNTANNDPQEMTDEQYMAKLNAAVTRLATKCDLPNDLTKLADIAEKNPAMFAMVLQTLRTTQV